MDFGCIILLVGSSISIPQRRTKLSRLFHHFSSVQHFLSQSCPDGLDLKSTERDPLSQKSTEKKNFWCVQIFVNWLNNLLTCQPDSRKKRKWSYLWRKPWNSTIEILKLNVFYYRSRFQCGLVKSSHLSIFRLIVYLCTEFQWGTVRNFF